MTFETIPANELHIPKDRVFDCYGRRALNSRYIEFLIKNFDPLMVQPVTIHRREDGENIVLDGVHTLVALRVKFGETVSVLCKVITDKMDPQEEALWFMRTQQPKKRLTKSDLDALRNDQRGESQ